MTTPRNQPVPVPVDDPLAAAMQPPPKRDSAYFGEVTILDVWFCKLVKGQGKVPFDPTQDDPSTRRIAIKLGITPLRGQYDIVQDTIDTAPDWRITLKSLQQNNLTLGQLKDRFVQVRRVPTGSTYISAGGETKERTAIQIIAVYPDRETCEAAANVYFGTPAPAVTPVFASEAFKPQQQPQAQPQQPVDVSHSARQFALQILPILWQNANRDEKAFRAAITANPMVSTALTEQDILSFLQQDENLPF